MGERTVSEQTLSEKTLSVRTPSERTQSERTQSEPTQSEPTQSERTQSERTSERARAPWKLAAAAVRLQSLYRGNQTRSETGVVEYDPYDGFSVTKRQPISAPKPEVPVVEYHKVPSGMALEQGLVQVAGHGMLRKAGSDLLFKETIPNELAAYLSVQHTPLAAHFPTFRGGSAKRDVVSIRIADATANCKQPAVMDVKMGTRTFLERELKSDALRVDLAQKLHALDASLVSAAQLDCGISKLDYMQARERLSSSGTFGWRIEGIQVPHGELPAEVKRIRLEKELRQALRFFVNDRLEMASRFSRQLEELRRTLEGCSWLETHEMVGSSLLFVYDAAAIAPSSAVVKMIDFAKSLRVADGRRLSHRQCWERGNREDGYLLGLDHLISCWKQICVELNPGFR